MDHTDLKETSMLANSNQEDAQLSQLYANMNKTALNC